MPSLRAKHSDNAHLRSQPDVSADACAAHDDDPRRRPVRIAIYSVLQL